MTEYKKVKLANALVNSDIDAAAAIAYSKLNLSNSIVNADIKTTAAIAYSKLAPLTQYYILQGNASNVATVTELEEAIRNAISGSGSQFLRRNAANTDLEFAGIPTPTADVNMARFGNWLVDLIEHVYDGLNAVQLSDFVKCGWSLSRRTVTSGNEIGYNSSMNATHDFRTGDTNFGSTGLGVEGKRGRVWSAVLGDDCQDNSLDTTTRWTLKDLSDTPPGNITATEQGGAATTDGYAKITAVGPGSSASVRGALYFKGKNFKGTGTKQVHARARHTGTNPTRYLVGVTDGTTFTTVYTSGSATSDIEFDLRYDFNNSAGTVAIYKNGTQLGSTTNISSLTAWYAWIAALASQSVTTVVKIYFFSYLEGGDTANMITEAYTAAATIEKGIASVKNLNNPSGGSTAISMSADNGANYQVITNNQGFTFTNTGTQIMLKVAFTNGSTLTLGQDNRGYFDNHGFGYVDADD